MNKRTEMGFQFAADTTHRIITLSASIILVTVTFSKDFVDSTERLTQMLALGSWILFFLSIVFGVFTLLVLVGEVAPKKSGEDSEPSIWSKVIRWAAAIQIILFLLGLGFVIWLAVKSQI